MQRATYETNVEHLKRVREWYDGAPTRLKWAFLGYRVMLAHDYGLLIPNGASVLEVGCGSGELLGRLLLRMKLFAARKIEFV